MAKSGFLDLDLEEMVQAMEEDEKLQASLNELINKMLSMPVGSYAGFSEDMAVEGPLPESGVEVINGEKYIVSWARDGTGVEKCIRDPRLKSVKYLQFPKGSGTDKLVMW